ncbi:MAG: xanthine phosphoribosyltransferase [Clostridia bacterium]|nr:xanthine phosphoribosyltransferase [Clostridia bacterium]
MRFLEERILKDGKVFPGNILKVDSFLNHQIDPAVIREIAEAFYQRFGQENVTKILTVEASGVAIAVMTADRFGVPMVFAKKSQTKNLSPDVYSASVDSFTHGNTSQIRVSKSFLSPEDRVLIVDDFLALGNATRGLMQITEEAGAMLVGIGIAIEKGFQGGGDEIRKKGIPLESLAVIDFMDDEGNIVFRP